MSAFQKLCDHLNAAGITFFVRDEANLTKKLDDFCADGLSKFQVVTDFDATISCLWTDASKSKKAVSSSVLSLETNNNFSLSLKTWSPGIFQPSA